MSSVLKGPLFYEHIHNPYERQASLYMKIPFVYIDKGVISIANRTIINGCSGRPRNYGIVQGIRIVDNKVITNPEEMYVFHWSYGRHFQEMGIIDSSGKPIKLAVVDGNRDLGNNDWHIAWQHDPPECFVWDDNSEISGPKLQDRLVRIDREPYTERTYNCLIAPIKGHLYIDDVRFSESQNVLDAETGTDISDKIDWLTYGKPIVRNGKIVDISDPKIIEQYGGDIRHILKLSEDQATVFPGMIEFTERLSDMKETEILKWLYDGYPEGFSKKALAALKSVPRSEYYFNIVGTTDESLIICQRQGKLEDVGQYLIDEHGIKDAIILDEGGSVACWASWHGSEGGFLNISYYFRPESISCIGFILK